MAKFTIQELYYGDKYCIMDEVVKATMQNPNWEHSDDLDTVLELEIIHQTLIVAEKMKQNGDCIARGELGDTVAIALLGGKHGKHN